MNSKWKHWVVGGLGALLAVTVALGAVTTTFANDQGTVTAEWRGGRGGLGRAGGIGHGASLTTIAGALNMTEADLQSALQTGKSVADLAKEKGVALQIVVDALVAEQTTALKQAVTDGRLTQEQADQHLAMLKANLPHLLSLKGGMGHGLGGPRGWGRFDGGRGQQGAPSATPAPSQQQNKAPVVPSDNGHL